MLIPKPPFEVTEEQRRSFHYFLESEFKGLFPPVFETQKEEDNAIRVWWAVEQKYKGLNSRVHDLRLALHRLDIV